MKTSLLFLIALSFMLGAIFADAIHSRRVSCIPAVLPAAGGWSI